ENSNSITVTSGSAGQNGSITVYASNGCGQSGMRSVNVTVSTVNDIGFNDNVSLDALSICAQTPATIVSGGNPGSSPNYQWQVSTTSPTAGFSLALNNTNNDQNYTVDPAYYNNA